MGLQVFAGDALQEQKIKYYELLARLHAQAKDYLSLCRDMYSTFTTPTVKEDRQRALEALSAAALFACLTPHDSEQVCPLCGVELGCRCV